MREEYPKLIEEKPIGEFTVSIYKTTYFYDIIISGDEKKLLELKKQNEYSNYMDYSKFGYPILIWDTCDTLDEAIYIMKEIEKEL